MYATINIGNPRMTCELLKGNSCMLIYAGCNGDSRVPYASCQWEYSRTYVNCNEDSRVRHSTLRKIIWKVGSRVNASHVMPIYSVLENFNPKMSFCIPT